MLRLSIVVVIFLFFTSILYIVWKLGPPAEKLNSGYEARFPLSLEQLKVTANFFSQYRDQHFAYVLVFFSLAYLYKQCFAIPGSFFMNLLAGALFGKWSAMLIVCPLTAVGASGCYLLSALAAKPIIDKLFAKRLRDLKNAVKQNQYRLVYFLISARIFPLTPHWLLNICSPFLNIPLTKFALSVFLGLIPYNLICVQAGGMLSEIHRPSEVINFKTTVELIVVSVAVFSLSFFFKRNTSKKLVSKKRS